MTLPRTIERRKKRQRAKAEKLRRQREWDALPHAEQARRREFIEMMNRHALFALEHNLKIAEVMRRDYDFVQGDQWTLTVRTTR